MIKISQPKIYFKLMKMKIMLLIISIFIIQENIFGKWQKLHVSWEIYIEKLGIDMLRIKDLC